MTLHSTLALVSRHGDTGHRGQQCCSAAVLQRWSRGDSCENVHLQMIMKVVQLEQLAVSCSAAGPGNSAQYSHCSIYTIYMSVSTISILSVLYLHWSTYRIYTTCTISTIFAAQYLYCTLHSIYTAVSTVSTLQLGLQQSTTLQQQHSGDQGGPEQGAGRTCRYIIQIAASIYQPRISV